MADKLINQIKGAIDRWTNSSGFGRTVGDWNIGIGPKFSTESIQNRSAQDKFLQTPNPPKPDEVQRGPEIDPSKFGLGEQPVTPDGGSTPDGSTPSSPESEKLPSGELTEPGTQPHESIFGDELKLQTESDQRDTIERDAIDAGGPSGYGDFGSGGCFAAGTMVALANGTRSRIEEIRPGDEVLAYDVRARVPRKRRVIATHQHVAMPVLSLKVRDVDARIFVTPVHRFFIADDWIPIGRATVGAQLSLYDHESGDLRPRGIVELAPAGFSVPVYNLTVEEDPVYFVEGILVHNVKMVFGLDGETDELA